MKIGHIVACGSLALAAAAFPALAQEQDAPDVKKRERIVIVESDGEGHDLGEHVVRIRRPGVPPRVRVHMMRDCEGEKTEVSAGGDDDKTKIVFCGKPGMSAAERAEKLEQMLGRLAERDTKAAERRSRLQAALQAKSTGCAPATDPRIGRGGAAPASPLGFAPFQCHMAVHDRQHQHRARLAPGSLHPSA